MANHTDLAVAGQQINAAKVTTPDGELDAAIGDRTILTTPDTNPLANNISTAVAIRRVKTKLDVISDTDGTLKTGAVDMPGVLGANVVTATAVAQSAFAFPNLVPDPFNRRQIVLAQEHGAALWYPRTQLTLDQTFLLVAGDTNNPYKGQTLRFLSTSTFTNAGKYISTARMGIKTGDQVTGAMNLLAASGGWGMQLQCADASLNLLGSFVSNVTPGTGFVTMSGSPVVFKTAPLTVVSNTAYIRIVAVRDSTSDPNGDIYAFWANKGATVSDYPLIGDFTDYLQEMDDARLGYTSVGTRMDQMVGNNAGRYYLQQWDKMTALRQRGTVGTVIRVGYTGHSWAANLFIKTPLRASLQDTWGDGGVGWVDFANTTGGSYPEGWTYASAGDWDDTNINFAGGENARGVQGAHTVTIDIATPAKKSITLTTNSIKIHFTKQPTGGKFEYQLTYNGSASGWTEVDTANGTEVYANTGAIATPGTAFPTLVEVRIKTLGTVGIKMHGISAEKTASNLVFFGLGNSGATIAEWLAMDPTHYQAAIAGLNLDLMIVQLGGTNDKSVNVVPSVFQQGLVDWAARFRAALPYVDVLFVSDSENAEAGKTYTMAQYAAAVRSAAALSRAGYAPLYEHFDVQAANFARGTTDPADGRHLTALGGQIGSDLITDFLRVGP